MNIISQVKEIADLVQKAGNIDLYKKIVELHEEIINLEAEKLELRKENDKYKILLSNREKLDFKSPFYFKKEDEVPYCPRCWENDNKTIHLILEYSQYRCPQCKVTIDITDSTRPLTFID